MSKRSQEDAQHWASEGEKAGIGRASAFVSQRAADLFLEGRDAEARAMRDLARQISELKSEIEAP